MTSGPSSRRARLRVALAGVFLAIVGSPTAAFAHAQPVGTAPADGQVVATSPDTISVSFDEQVSLPSSGNQLLDAGGEPVEAVVSVRDDQLTFEPADVLQRGTYVVSWRVTSADSHPVSGGFTFSVGAPSASTVAVPTGAKQREVDLVRYTAEAVRYGGVLALVGIVGFVAMIATGAVRAHAGGARALWRTAVTAGALGVAGQAVLVPVTALWESGEPLSAVGRASTWSTAVGSSVSIALVLMTAGTCVALAGLRSGRDLLASAGAAAALGSLAAVGHTRSFGPSWLVLSADLVHLGAAAIWWGGLIALIVCLSVAPPLRAKVRGVLVASFSTAAGICVVAVIAAGVLLYWRIGHSWSGLWETPYGRFALLKVALVLPVLGIAAWNRTRLVPRLDSRSDEAAGRLLSRLVRVEAGILVVVVVVTGLLVTQTPPARSTPSAPVVSEQVLDLELDATHRATVVVTPVRRGVNALQVTVTGSDGQPVAGLGDPELSVSLRSSDIGPLSRPLAPTGEGTWEATADLPLEGTWTITLSVPLSRFENPVVTGTVEVP